MSRNRILRIVLIVVLVGLAYYFYGRHTTPKGQPPLLSFSPGDVTPLKTEFNNSASFVRVLVMLSPTWAICLQGASATGQLLRDFGGKDLRVYVVWEPVLPTDLAAPSSAALARVADVRATQYWDHKRNLSHVMGEKDRSTIVWDYIAVYAPGEVWQDAPPKPVFADNPVRKVIGGAKTAVQGLLANAGQTNGK